MIIFTLRQTLVRVIPARDRSRQERRVYEQAEERLLVSYSRYRPVEAKRCVGVDENKTFYRGEKDDIIGGRPFACWIEVLMRGERAACRNF